MTEMRNGHFKGIAYQNGRIQISIAPYDPLAYSWAMKFEMPIITSLGTMLRQSTLFLPLCMAMSVAPLGACKRVEDPDAGRMETAKAYPPASRPVSALAGNQWSTETARDKRGEAEEIMKAAGLKSDMTVADIGAGEGYYTVRLAEKVGENGRVLAQDIDEEAIDRLAARVNRENLDNVSIKLGAPDDPRLPENSFDRIFLVHMYHEVREPYAFLSRLRPALIDESGITGSGEVIVVDVNRDFSQHGIPPKQLFCEFEAVGYELIGFMERPELGGYFARFKSKGDAILPGKIEPCPYSGPEK